MPDPIIKSLLDTDLYKITMGQAVLFGKFAGVSYQSIDAEFEFINRGGTEFPGGFAARLQEQVNLLGELRLSQPEERFLRGLRYIKRAYVDFLRGYQFDPNQVHIQQTGGKLTVTIRGPWYSAILWEVPLLAIVSELYFRMRGLTPDADYLKRADEKGHRMEVADCYFTDFGTRRRFSFDVHNNVVERLKKCKTFVGTSNLYLAMLHGLTPIGTHAHEWFSAHAALFGFRQANRFALEAWAEEFDGDLGTALADTFTSKVFFQQFSMDLAKLFDGVRQDSGDPLEFARMAIDHYQMLRIDPSSKSIIFSDGLTDFAAIDIGKWCRTHGHNIQPRFGIGTYLTNDVGAKPLNIVIKMVKCNGIPTVKLSDAAGKHTGDSQTIEVCKFQLGVK